MRQQASIHTHTHICMGSTKHKQAGQMFACRALVLQLRGQTELNRGFCSGPRGFEHLWRLNNALLFSTLTTTADIVGQPGMEECRGRLAFAKLCLTHTRASQNAAPRDLFPAAVASRPNQIQIENLHNIKVCDCGCVGSCNTIFKTLLCEKTS